MADFTHCAVFRLHDSKLHKVMSELKMTGGGGENGGIRRMNCLNSQDSGAGAVRTPEIRPSQTPA